MNPKITKLKSLRRKNEDLIAKLRAQNADIDQQVTELENLEIIGMVRKMGLTLEALETVIQNPCKHTEGSEQEEAEEYV